MFTYDKLINLLINQNMYPISIKKKYVVIMFPGINYHVTIFRDQWDDYEKITKKPYNMFHVSSNNEYNRCSSYFWVSKNTNKIKNIPEQFFIYNQPNYTFFSSTRSPCDLGHIESLLAKFQKILIGPH